MRKHMLGLVFIVFIIVVGVHALTQQPAEPNVFNVYSDYMPGRDINKLAGCKTYYIPNLLNYLICNTDLGRIEITAKGSTIVTSVFYQKQPLALPNLIQWFGKYTSLVHSRGDTYVKWNQHITAYFPKWGGMYSFPAWIIFK